jgi:class 3 adenylate cyclase
MTRFSHPVGYQRDPQARRPVTVLCVALQVAPSAGLALDPEAHGVVNEHVVSGLTTVLERHGGRLAVSDSEHLMGVFGVTTVHEDDALRAVRASLEARDALAAEADTLPRRYRANLVCRFGLATVRPPEVWPAWPAGTGARR